MELNNLYKTVRGVVSTTIEAFKFHDIAPSGVLTEADIESLYRQNKSFTNYLPYKDYDPELKIFRMADGRSCAAVHDFIPVNSEGVSLQHLAGIRDKIQMLIKEAFEEFSVCPWVVEFYQSDELSLDTFSQQVETYFNKNGEHHRFKDEVLHMYRTHLRDVCKDGGIFSDTTVTDMPWRGATRLYRMVFYRKYSGKAQPPKNKTIQEELLAQRDRVESRLKSLGISSRRVDADSFWESMFRWFNPCPGMTNGDVNQLVDNFRPDFSADGQPYGRDFSELLCVSAPSIDWDEGIVYFDEKPHSLVTVMGLRNAPYVGSISASKSIDGTKARALFDEMPEGTVMCMKVVVEPREKTNSEIGMVRDRSVGTDAYTKRVIDECDSALNKVAQGDPMYPVELSFFVRGEDKKDLSYKRNDVSSVLANAGFMVIDTADDLIAARSYLYNLPMCYDPSKLKERRRSRFWFSEHIANVVPLFGRARGTGNPGFIGFNRGGEMACCDPLNGHDRSKNGHMLIFGPTGAGKSVQLIKLITEMVAIHNARVFVIEAGNSFGEQAKWMHENGLTVTRKSMTVKDKSVVAPFANAIKALEAEEQYAAEAKQANQDFYERLSQVDSPLAMGQSIDDLFDQYDDEEYVKDYLGEMEIIAQIMISGGEPKEAERITVGDKNLIRLAILEAARKVRDSQRVMVLTQDVRDELMSISRTADSDAVKNRFEDYSNAMDYFCTGIAGQKFNRAGEMWEECDVTFVDLAEFTKDNRKAELAVSYVSILNFINDIAERDVNSSRPIIAITDEGHIITKNPLITPAVVKIVKMWRKLGAWFWLATQNMADFPNEAAAILSLCEWWFCLALEAAEVDEVARFKRLTDEQKDLLLSCRKQKGAYTEGVIFSSKVTLLVRSVLPSFLLAIAGTDTDERSHRKIIRDTHKCSWTEANRIVAGEIDQARGILRDKPE